MRSDEAKRLIAEDAESIKTRLVLAVLADDDGIVHLEKTELADLFGVSLATMRRRLKLAGIREDAVGRSLAAKLSDDLLQNLTPFLYNVHVDSLRKKEEVCDQNASLDWRDVVAYYRDRYAAKYGAKPRIDYRIVKNIVNGFIRRYGQDVYAIIDAVFANYATVWKTAKYPTPSIGAICGWLGEKAYAYVEKREPAQETKETKTDVEAWL